MHGGKHVQLETNIPLKPDIKLCYIYVCFMKKPFLLKTTLCFGEQVFATCWGSGLRSAGTRLLKLKQHSS